MHIDTSSSGVAATTTRMVSPGCGAKRCPALVVAILLLANSILPGFAQTPVTQYAGVSGPVGLALDTVGGVTYLYVADEARGNIVKLDVASGTAVATFGTGSQGTEPGAFGRPYGIAVDPTSHDLYVTERLNGRVQRINSTTGAHVMSWGINDAVYNASGQNTAAPNPSAPQGHFQEPIGIAADAAGNVYVVDHGNNRVQKFLVSQAGGVWTAANAGMWGTTGIGNGEFNRPYGAALDASGNLWVADGLNGRVQKFSSSGTYLGTVGSQGSAAGQFIIATWVGFDASGALYVASTNSDPQATGSADINNQWISKFTPSGGSATYVSRFGGTAGSSPGQFRLPFGIVVDAANRAYVSDYYNSRVQVISLAGGPAPGAAPTVTSFTAGTPTAGSVTFQVVFSAAVTGVDAADFTVTPGSGATATIGTVTGSGSTYAVPVTFSGTGTVQLALKSSGTGIADAASGTAFANGGSTSATFTIPGGGGGGTTDTTAPTVSSFTMGATTASSVAFQIVFSEMVTGVGASDFDVVTTGGATATIGTVSGSGSTYTVAVSFAGTGSVQLNLKTSGTGIADAAGNPIASGATGPVHTITSPPAGGGTSVTVLSVEAPAAGTYAAGDALVVKVRFSAPVTVKRGDDDDDDDYDDDESPSADDIEDQEDAGRSEDDTKRENEKEKEKEEAEKDDDEDDDDDSDNGYPYIRWTAVAASGQHADSGRLKYQFGSGTPELTFKYQVHGNDSAPQGIMLGTQIELPAGAAIKDAAGGSLTAAQLNLSWSQNPLSGVILVQANMSNPGVDNRNGTPGVSNGGGQGKGKRAKLVNLSSRVHVKGDDPGRLVVVGFVVSGSEPQTVLVRAVGPGLRAFGISDALSAPVLTVRDSSGQVVASNSGWRPDAIVMQVMQRVGAFNLAAGSLDCALVLKLAPGAYTVTITGAKGNGTALVEVYDAGDDSVVATPQLVNISTRGFVESGGNLIIGLAVRGTEPKRLLVRAIGPGLTTFGVPNALADPNMELRDATGALVARNADWGTPLSGDSAHTAATPAEITAVNTATGAFPMSAGSKDAAVVVTLDPGAYTVVVTGAGAGSGAVLVEVYEVPVP